MASCRSRRLAPNNWQRRAAASAATGLRPARRAASRPGRGGAAGRGPQPGTSAAQCRWRTGSAAARTRRCPGRRAGRSRRPGWPGRRRSGYRPEPTGPGTKGLPPLRRTRSTRCPRSAPRSSMSAPSISEMRAPVNSSAATSAAVRAACGLASASARSAQRWPGPVSGWGWPRCHSRQPGGRGRPPGWPERPMAQAPGVERGHSGQLARRRRVLHSDGFLAPGPHGHSGLACLEQGPRRARRAICQLGQVAEVGGPGVLTALGGEPGGGERAVQAAALVSGGDREADCHEGDVTP